MNLTEIFGNMGMIGWAVVIALLIMSIYSITIMIDKWRTFRSSRAQSLTFLPEFVRCLKDNKLQAAVDVTRKYRKSHLAKVVVAGLMEFMTDEGEFKDGHDLVNACGRALERANALTSAEMKKGLGVLATIGSTAPFVGLFGTVVGIIHAFQGIAASGSGGIASVSAGIAEALITTAFGLFVAIPAVMAFNYFTSVLERFQIEMSNSSAELMDFFLKKTEGVHASR
ncbi:MAG TPA: MotA/TolQ/ExbB proton channel family protein [Candidatus Polarisedimenticolaceae bacterium]|nr:MotA/TolQ/ExbB proton channel family protein [Candidatus Polarisedimenticolaceae bacterium]